MTTLQTLETNQHFPNNREKGHRSKLCVETVLEDMQMILYMLLVLATLLRKQYSKLALANVAKAYVAT